MQRLKYVVKQWIPPVLLDGVRYFREKPSFRGPLTESEAQSLVKTDVFRSDAWLKHTSRKLVSSSPLLRDGHLTVHRFLLSTLVSLCSFRSPMKVVDWGGGGGELYESVISQTEHPENVQYIVVDNEKLIALGRDLFPQVVFLDSGKVENLALLREADMLFMSSVLQYIPNWSEFLGYVAGLKPRLFVICRHLSPDSQCNSFFVAQTVNTRSGLAGVALVQLINWRLVVGVMNDHGYRLVSTMVSEQPTLLGSAQDKEYGLTERLLVFERKEVATL